VEKYGTAGQDADDNKIRRMRFACWVKEATDAHPEYVIIFPRQKWLLELVSMLRLSVAYIACLLVYFYGSVGPHEHPPPPG